MEEPGMDRGRYRGTGLLKAAGAPVSHGALPIAWGRLILPLLLAPVFFPLFLAAQTPPSGLRILMESDPPAPVAGSRWTLTLLIDYPSPGELDIRPPRFPDALFLEQSRRESRLVGAERWTAVEYRFMLREAGWLTIPAFEVITPLGRGRTAPLALTIHPSGDRPEEFRPRLEWEPVLLPLELGKPVEICLRLLDWDPRRPVPGAAVFSLPAPEGLILELEEPRAGDREAGRVLRLRLIPLAGPRLILPGQSVRYGDYLLDIPPLSLPVYESAVPRTPERAPVPPPPALVPGAAAPPEIDFRILPAPPLRRIFRFAYEPLAARVQSLWEAGDRASALAELRRFERDHPAGPLLKDLRRDMEKALGLEYTEDEAWRPRGLFFLGLLGGLAGIALSAAFRFFRPPASRRAGFFVIIWFGLVGICLWGLIAGRGFPPGRSSGVVRETTARRIPDSSGEAAAYFREGQCVSIRSGGGSWVWVEAPASAGAGWMPREDVVFY